MIIRVLAVIGALALIYIIVKLVSKPSEFRKCQRCDGKGFWYDARGKETCDWCKGSGKLPNHNS